MNHGETIDIAVRDLLRHLNMETPKFRPFVLEVLKETIPYTLNIESEDAEIKAIEKVIYEKYRSRFHSRKDFAKYDYWNFFSRHTFKGLLMNLLYELHHYVPETKEIIIDVTLTKVLAQVDIVERLEKIVRQINQCWQSLDLRSKALIKIARALTKYADEVDSKCVDEICEGDKNWSIQALRDEPSLKDLTEAYDLTCAYRAATD